MKITICGSIEFYDKMLDLETRLKEKGHEIFLPPKIIRDNKGKNISVQEYYKLRQNSNENELWIWQKKRELMLRHFKKIEDSDSILVANYSKKGIENYIGGNTFGEMNIALYLNKGIYLLNTIPNISYKEEIIAMNPKILNGDLTKIFNKQK